MDFIEGLLKSEGKEVIMVVVDRFTEYGHFIGLSHPYSASTVAKVFVDNIHKLYGLPSYIISDRDTIFLATFGKNYSDSWEPLSI